MYQETERFQKYGKRFVPLVAGAFALPFVIALIVELFSDKFNIGAFLFVVVALMIVIVVPIMAMVLAIDLSSRLLWSTRQGKSRSFRITLRTPVWGTQMGAHCSLMSRRG